MAAAGSSTLCARNGTAHDGTLVCYWADSPDTRGTLDIFWLCMSTLCLCVWNAVHPGIPSPGSSWLRAIRIRVGWLLIGLFMPEVLVLIALAELRQAMKLLAAVEQAGILCNFPWWWMYLQRSSIPQNRSIKTEDGFWMKLMPRCFRQAAPQNHASTHSQAREHPWTLTHSFYAVIGGYYGPHVSSQGQSSHTLDLDTIHRWVHQDPMFIPDIPADDLDDRSKVDSLAKLLLIWQLFVFLANCAARWDQDLPLSLLEITTISHSLCSLIALLLWLYKPHSITKVTMVGNASPPERPAKLTWWKIQLMVLPGTKCMDVPRTIAIVAIAGLYGVPHLLGLSAQFPSGTEKSLWEIATFAVIGLPLIICFKIWIVETIHPHLDSNASYLAARLLEILCLVFSILYPVCSMLLVGESFRQVFALPEGSFYEPQLTRYLPSFS